MLRALRRRRGAAVSVRVRVVRNDLPRVIRGLPLAADEGVDQTAVAISDTIRATAWRDTNVAISTVVSKTEGVLGHAEVGVGQVGGRGFYVKFLEFGTTKMPAQPRVQPAAHAAEPLLAVNVTTAIRRLAA